MKSLFENSDQFTVFTYKPPNLPESHPGLKMAAMTRAEAIKRVSEIINETPEKVNQFLLPK